MNVFAHPSSKQKKIYTAMLLLGLAALFVTGFLINLHLKPAEVGSFCNLDDYWNCDRVNKSTFAELMGIPVSYLGFAFYSFLTISIVGLIKGIDFSKRLKPITPNLLLAVTSIFASAGGLYLLFLEAPFLGNLTPLALTKTLIFTAAYLGILKKFYTNKSGTTVFLAFLSIITLFGVHFSLYLTDIELFVLEAICLFCLTQQILIIFITGLGFYALKESNHG